MWKQVAKEMAYCPYCGAKKEEDIWDETEDVIREKAGQAVEFVKEKQHTQWIQLQRRQKMQQRQLWKKQRTQ